jgi:hypothetical protein
MLYTPGDHLRAVRERVRVHRPVCVMQRGECGCSLRLVAQPWRYYHNDQEVTEAEYGQLRAQSQAANAGG